jgi:hypothetical protein
MREPHSSVRPAGVLTGSSYVEIVDNAIILGIVFDFATIVCANTRERAGLGWGRRRRRSDD